MPSFFRCIASTESKRVASAHRELAGNHMIVSQSEAWVEDLEVLCILQGKRVGALQEVHMLQDRVILDVGYILQGQSLVGRFV